MLNKITLALLLTPILAFSAAQKPSLVKMIAGFPKHGHESEQLAAVQAIVKAIDGGADVQEKDKYRESCLHSAVTLPLIARPVVTRLLERGASVDAKNSSGAIPAWLALGKNHFEALLYCAKPHLENHLIRSTCIWPLNPRVHDIALLVEAGVLDNKEPLLESTRNIGDPQRLVQVTRALESGAQRAIDRPKNIAKQFFYIQDALGNTHIPIKELLLIIHEYVGLKYTIVDGVPLTRTIPINGPASCYIEEQL